MALSTVINNQSVSWSRVGITFSPGLGLPGLTLQTIKSIDYEYKINLAKQYGQGNKAIGRTDGIVEIGDASIEIGEADWAKLVTLFTPFGGISFLQTELSAFEISVNYQQFPVSLPNTDVLQGVRITSIKQSPKQGADGVMVTLGLSVMDISLGNPSFNVGGISVGL